MTALRAPLPEGPLDIVGDIHGELAALDRLLARLGCDPHAGVAQRPLVFVGDLVDRGPDSPGVVRRVKQLVDAGLAWAVAGNHELNLLLDDPKEGNGWFLGHADGYHHESGTRPFESAPVDPAEADELRAFLGGLPLVLERPDLRVVHASWDAASVARLPSDGDLTTLAAAARHDVKRALREQGVFQRAMEERARFADLKDPTLRPQRPLPATVEVTLTEQQRNPYKVLTSGQEEVIPDDEDLFYVGGKWRVVRRARWWNRYDDDAAVVVGHYWRTRVGVTVPGKRDVFDGLHPFAWAGPRGRVYCVDYSVGRRFVERWRQPGRTTFDGALAALRWPERVLVFDDRDEVVPTTGFGG